MTGLSTMSSGSRDLSLGRSSSLKQVMEKRDWRSRAVGTMTSDDQVSCHSSIASAIRRV